jgi:eukaryotic-like serine/threonine-protein kinase
VVAAIGRGGMGEVYRAVDTRVGRSVALKLLPADAAVQPDRRQRFEREAKSVARLNHPHICTLYDVGVQDGMQFLVMEYLDGETLAARLARGALPLAEALRHGTALAEALARAHRAGIVHRDLKPSNVMLTESGVKLLDFGLAKLRESDEPRPVGDASTSAGGVSPEGTLVGTIAYMSPEQIAGRVVDNRTDIYALGLILYEMITGRRAFAKPSQAALIAAIMTEEPQAITACQPDAPAAVERIVLTALAKDPDQRWQTASDLARELAWAAGGSHTTTAGGTPHQPRRRVNVWVATGAAAAIVATAGVSALLWRGAQTRVGRTPASRDLAATANPPAPLTNLVILPCRGTDDATAEAYCNGLTDTLSAKMTPIAARRGVQITSTLEVRRRGVDDAIRAHREFGATVVLEGSIARAGDTLRINYVFVDAATLRQIDAFSGNSAVGDPFALQDRVATWAADALALQLEPAEHQTLTTNGTRAPGALDLYLQARGYLLDFQRPRNVDTAIDLLNRAIALDSQFAAAYAALGGAFWHKYESTQEAGRVEQARVSCSQAVTLDPGLAASHVCLGTIAFGTGEYETAVAEFQRALDRDSTSDEATLGLARAQARSGDVARAETTYTRAIALRPQYWATYTWLGTFYREQGRYADAAQQYQRALTMTPDNARVYYILGGLYGSIGRYEEAIAACSRSVQLQPSWDAYSNWGMTLFRMRRFDEAVAKLEDARRVGPETYRVIGNLARAYYYSGRRADATAAYARAIELADQALAVNPRDIDTRVSLATYYAKRADRANAIAQVNRLPAELSDPHVLLFVAFVFADLGDRGAALDWLERATRQGLAPNELREWIDLDPLRNDARFAALLRR